VIRWTTGDRVQKESNSDLFIPQDILLLAMASPRSVRVDRGKGEDCPLAELIVVPSMPMWYKET
jgi:hypothetical protein